MFEADGDTAAMVPLAAILGGCFVGVEEVLEDAVELVLEVADPQAASIAPPASTLAITRIRRFKLFSLLVIQTAARQSERAVQRELLDRHRTGD